MDQTLSLLAADVRGKTLKLLDGIDDAQAVWKPAGTNNHILWHAGHAFTVVQALGIAPLAGKDPVYPDGWFEKFSWKSTPASVTAWPRLSEVVAALQKQLTDLTSAIQAATPQQLDAVNENGRSLRWRVMHGLHDEACHQGEIHLLKKLHARR